MNKIGNNIGGALFLIQWKFTCKYLSYKNLHVIQKIQRFTNSNSQIGMFEHVSFNFILIFISFFWTTEQFYFLTSNQNLKMSIRSHSRYLMNPSMFNSKGSCLHYVWRFLTSQPCLYGILMNHIETSKNLNRLNKSSQNYEEPYQSLRDTNRVLQSH